MYEHSIRKRYHGGFTLHEIDAHPDGSYYRGPNNHFGTVAFPDEHYMLMLYGTPVCFMEKTEDMNRLFPNLKELEE